jgi:hypothetical protein
MPDKSPETPDLEEMMAEESGDDDYGFVVGADGELKSVFVPDVGDNSIPENVLNILKLFGINDIGGQRTLH